MVCVWGERKGGGRDGVCVERENGREEGWCVCREGEWEGEFVDR